MRPDLADEARRIQEAALALVQRTAPGAEALVEVHAGRRANTRFAQNEVTSCGDARDVRVTVTLAFGKRHAETSTTQTDEASLGKLVERAAAMAKLAPEDPEWMPVLGQQDHAASDAAFDPLAAGLGAEVRAQAAAAAIRRAGEGSLWIAGYHEHGNRLRSLMSSRGLAATFADTYVDLTMTARTRDGTGSGWAGAVSHRAADVRPGELAEVACDKAVRSQTPQKLDPGRYTVVLEPAAVGDLLWFLTESLDARNADEGRSFFAKKGGGTRVGEKIFADGIALRSDPHDAATPGAPFDGEGFPLQATSWIDRGTLQALWYSRYWATKQGKDPTGRPTTWHLGGGTAATPTDLLAGVERGLLVTRLWYIRWVDPQSMLVTGLTRDGVWLIEKGKVTTPVQNFRFNESPAVVLKNTDLATRDTVRVRNGMTRVPALRTHEFNMASVSAAI
jgi:predicted Zn-dependent protease